MFTGLVEALATVGGLESRPPGLLLKLSAADIIEGTRIGDSIAINGCCLTVVGIEGPQLFFEAGQETLQRTNLGQLQLGDQVNVERSLAVGQRMGGHFVTGHIDAVGHLHSRQDEGPWSTCWFQVPAALTRQMASKGSIAVDGVSLTLVDVQADRFSVALIPHTLAHTTLGRRKAGEMVNLETDILAKYIEAQQQSPRLAE